MANKQILADIEYNPYAVLIAHIDGESFFQERTQMNAFRKASDIFTRECGEYYRHLKSNIKTFTQFISQGHANEDTFKFADYLYNPACFVGFGDNDNIAFVAMDDFDLSTHLISQVELPIRQTCLAFSPKVDSLGLNKNIFCEIEEICNTPLDRNKKNDSDAEWKKRIQSLKAPNHDFLDKRPLVAITYYKLNGMAVLGPGLLMQQAAYRAIASEIESTLKEINPIDDSMANAIENFRCTLLDPQGWADLASIMFCSDYSVIATVLSRVRSITHKHLYQNHSSKNNELKPKYQKLENHISSFGLHDKMSKIFPKAVKDIWNLDLKPYKQEQVQKQFQYNHIFCSTFSTLGISHKAFESDRQEDHISGHLISDTKLVCSTGHCKKMKEVLENKEDNQKRFVAPYSPLPHEPYAWYLTGHDDFIYQQMFNKDYDCKSVVRLSDFIRQVKSMRDCDLTNKSDPQSYLSYHALEMSSELRIPVYYNANKNPTSNILHIEPRIVLQYCKKKLFSNDCEIGFNLAMLQDSIRKIRLPAPLSTSVRFLFLDYANCLSDVFLFDHVVDLHDIFSAFYNLIVKKLDKNMSERVKSVYEARTFLDGADMDNIVEMVELLRNALTLRAQIAFREAERWGITLDIRGGGFNRLLNTADIPLKCGLGLLKRVVKGEANLKHTNNGNTDIWFSDTINQCIGGASGITYDSRSYSHRLDIGYNYDYFITSVDLNLIHLTRPRNLLIHLHETSHLICHFLRDRLKCSHPEYNCYQNKFECHRCSLPNIDKEENSLLKNRFEEIFAEMLVHKLVFDSDYKVYLRQYIANYSIGYTAYNNDQEELFYRIFELLIRGFLITDPFRRPDIYTEEDLKDITPELLNDGFNKFNDFLSDISSFLIDFDDFKSNAPDSKLRHYFNEAFTESYHPIRCIFFDINTIYVDICQNKLDPAPDDIISLEKQIRDGLRKGRPLIRNEFLKEGQALDVSETERLDPLFLIRYLMRRHIRNIFKGIDTSIYTAYISRDIDGFPYLKKDNRKTKIPYKQCLDRNFNGLVAADPTTRKKYMLERIVILKTLWDISTNLRARRLFDILDTVEKSS